MFFKKPILTTLICVFNTIPIRIPNLFVCLFLLGTKKAGYLPCSSLPNLGVLAQEFFQMNCSQPSILQALNLVPFSKSHQGATWTRKSPVKRVVGEGSLK